MINPHRIQLFVFATYLLFSFQSALACSGGTSAGSLTPTAGYQTQTVTNGEYYAVNVTCGNTYNFTFCSNGGTATWDTQITINQTNNTTQLAYNDDNCGLQSNVSWTANFTGTVHVLISLYSCNNAGGNTGTMAYNVTTGSNNASFTMTANNCSTASANITGDLGGTFGFNPAPGDGAIINSATGAISNGTPGTTYTVEYSVNCGVSSTQNVTLPASGNASFTLNDACGGATATINGDTGGTFTFNPAPGDGAQVNSTTGAVTNGTTGTTYYVEYTVCGVSTIESITVLTDDCWVLNGDAQFITVGGDDCIQLTDEINNQTGCAWSGSQIDFNQDFSLSLDYYFGNNVNGADGNTFTFQPSASTACGTAGGQLGAGGISNALAIEFDTYDNDYPTHIYDMLCDHVAIETDGNHQNGVPAAGPACAKSGGGNIDDGGLYEVEISWNATTQTLDVYFDGVWVLDYTDDIVNNVFGGQNLVYWGATSATGGLNNEQYFCPSTIVILPVELSSFESTCNGSSESFVWVTQSEENTDHFVLEYTYDGYVFYPEAFVDATGNSEEEITYSVRVETKDEAQRYYRLKVVDLDGAIQTSDIIASKNCAVTNKLIQYIAQADGQINVNLTEKSQIKMIDVLGKTVVSSEENQTLWRINSAAFPSGVYQVIAVSETGRIENNKIIIH